jgi:Regulator of G protein signaling domain
MFDTSYDTDTDKPFSHYSDRPPHSGGGQIGDRNLSPFLRTHSRLEGAKTPPPLARPGSPTGDPSEDDPSKGRIINRADLRAAAEKILYTYLTPGSEREVALPRDMVIDIQTAIEKDMRDDPEVFDGAREYIFQAMEKDAFPGFLRAKALGNLVRFSALLRLITGLVCLFAGFWTAFSLIFLGYDRLRRCWVFFVLLMITKKQLILPFTLGVYMLFAHEYNLDPIIGLYGYSECTFMSFRRIDEPYGTHVLLQSADILVRKLLNRRSWVVLLLTVLVSTALSVLFIFVPSRRI